jgi:putative transcriptional regulator
MIYSPNNPDDAVLRELGQRLATHRLGRHMTQDQLASDAGVSKRTLVRLEQGESVQLTNLVRVLRALGLLHELESLVPPPLASPIEALKSKRISERRRASSPSTPAPARKWVWGDEQGKHNASEPGDHTGDA